MKGGTADSHMASARQGLASSRTLLQAGDPSGSCNRAYYAMFYAAHAALTRAGIIADGMIYKSHSGLIGAVGKELVLTERLSKQLGRSLSQVFDLRLLADYDGAGVKTVNAEWAVAEAETFVAKIAEALPRLGAA